MTRISLAGKKCLLTGGSGGLGRVTARRIAGLGCDLFLTARRPEPLTRLGQDLKNQGGNGRVAWAAADLTSISDINVLIDRVKKDFGSIDILINNAGVFPVLPFENSGLKDYDLCFDLNVKAPFLLAKAFIPDMLARGWGRIVNIGSSSAYAGFRNTALYCSSKHALLGMSRSLNDEYKARGVRTCFLAPGSMQTDMGRLVPGQTFETFIDPEELAEYLLMVISFDGNAIIEETRMNRVIIK
jgi:NAD(P)-dependent dehydrogenase (short-subunit alcohol dehydrogenase family)